MSDYQLKMIPVRTAEAYAAQMTMRGDMAAQFEAEGGQLPPGPIWSLGTGERLLGLGGLERRGAGASLGWLLAADGLSIRDWAVARWALRSVLDWARSHSIRRVHAAVEAGNAGAQRLLASLDFEPTGRDGKEITMTLELTR